jgi:hypothetical protein
VIIFSSADGIVKCFDEIPRQEKHGYIESTQSDSMCEDFHAVVHEWKTRFEVDPHDQAEHGLQGEVAALAD